MTLQRKTQMTRKPMKRSVPKRLWEDARDKVDEEGRCRVCSTPDGSLVDGERIHLEAAHTVGREHDRVEFGPKGGKTLVVRRESVIPLCQHCHRQYDEHRLDLLPFLFLPEQIEAVRASGGIANANRRLSGRNA